MASFVSVDVARVRPSRQAGHHVELPKQITDDLVRVVLFAKLFEAGEDACQGGVDFPERGVGITFTLLLQTASVLQELFTVKLEGGRGRDRRPAARQKAKRSSLL